MAYLLIYNSNTCDWDKISSSLVKLFNELEIDQKCTYIAQPKYSNIYDTIKDLNKAQKYTYSSEHSEWFINVWYIESRNSIEIKIDNKRKNDREINLSVLMSLKGFLIGYRYDAIFFTNEMTTNIELLKKRNIPIDNNKVRELAPGLKVYDISKNYGRAIEFYSCRLMVAPSMFVSRKMQQILPKEKLDSLYIDQIKVEELNYGILHYKLMDHVDKSYANYELIKLIWNKFEFDLLCKQWQNELLKYKGNVPIDNFL